MSKIYSTKIILDDYPKEFSSVEARDASIIPTIYDQATRDRKMDIRYEQIRIVNVWHEEEHKEGEPLELTVEWQVAPKG